MTIKKKKRASSFAGRFPNNLPKALERAGVSRAQLAKDLGMDRPYLSRLISGHYQPMVSTALIVCNALGTTVEKMWPEYDSEAFRDF